MTRPERGALSPSICHLLAFPGRSVSCYTPLHPGLGQATCPAASLSFPFAFWAMLSRPSQHDQTRDGKRSCAARHTQPSCPAAISIFPPTGRVVVVSPLSVTSVNEAHQRWQILNTALLLTAERVWAACEHQGDTSLPSRGHSSHLFPPSTQIWGWGSSIPLRNATEGQKQEPASPVESTLLGVPTQGCCCCRHWVPDRKWEGRDKLGWKEPAQGIRPLRSQSRLEHPWGRDWEQGRRIFWVSSHLGGRKAGRSRTM